MSETTHEVKISRHFAHIGWLFEQRSMSSFQLSQIAAKELGQMNQLIPARSPLHRTLSVRVLTQSRLSGTRFVRFWERFQVELKGRFSAQRVGRAREYCESTSWIRVILLCLLTPLPALIVITLVDCMPLAPTERGRNGNAIYWIRMHLFIFIMVSGRIKQFHCCVPRLDLRVRQVITVAFATATSATLFVYVLSSAVGFPVPFAVICASLFGLPTAIFSMFMVLRKMIRTDPELKSDLDSHFLVFIGETMMTYIYPMYLSAFKSLSPSSQSAFTLLLPLIKVTLRNHFGRVLRGVDDVKPVFVVFNVDLFSALYVTSCLQSSQSSFNIVLISIVDIIQLTVSIADVRSVLKEIHAIVRRDQYDGSLLSLCSVVASNPKVRTELDRQCLSSKIANASRYNVSTASTRQIVPVASSLQKAQKTLLPAGIRSAQRVRLVQKITKVLYIAEFVLLIEFAEVMIPIIYSMYLVAMTYLPNKAFYHQLASLDEYQLNHTIANVMLNATLEMFSFLLVCWLLQRELRTSTMHLLAFALDTERVLIQASLLSWILYVNQQSLTHNGVDFTFRFAWLHPQSP